MNVSPAFMRTNQNSARLKVIQDVPEELTVDERAALPSVEEVQVMIQNEELLLHIHHSRLSAEAIDVLTFGYRPDAAFGDMLKLETRVSIFGHELYNGNTRLPRENVVVQTRVGRTTIRIPLKLLGHPSHLFTSVRTYVGELPIDWTAWRILQLSPEDVDR
ncbi:MAG: hypothetical protein JWM16_2330 [Verrucomicrobiales bacterium]|nr:hypothetical protein [Verrucomicrobiales bacterium]